MTDAPEREPSPDVASSEPKSQPDQPLIPTESSSQPTTAPEPVAASWARARLEDYGCPKAEATPSADFHNNVDHVLSQQQQENAPLPVPKSPKEHDQPPTPDADELTNLEELGKQLKLVVEKTSKTCHSVLCLSSSLMHEVSKKRKRGKTRQEFANALANLGAKLVQEGVYFQNALDRLEEANFALNQDMELEETCAHHWNACRDILDNLIDKMKNILEVEVLSGPDRCMVKVCKQALLRRQIDAMKLGLWPYRPKPAPIRTDTTTNLGAPAGGVESEGECLEDMGRTKKAKTGAEPHNKKRVRWRDTSRGPGSLKR